MIRDDEGKIENAKETWRAEARERALQDVKAEGLHGEAAKERFEELFREHYAELEEIGMENNT